MREGGEATRYFCIHNCDSLAVASVANFDPLLAGRDLAAIGRADNHFVVCSFGLS